MTRIISHPPETAEEATLEQLERQVVDGQRALDHRNELMVSMHAGGWTKASLFHRLNRVRHEMGADLLSRSAIDVTIRRAHRNRPDGIGTDR